MIFLFVIGFTFFVRINSNSDVTVGNLLIPQNGTNLSANLSVQRPSISSGISAVDLATHDSLSDCWVAYKGKVYDITSFLPNHPGSAGAIVPYCGTSSEFETAFTRQHGTSKANLLMRVGVLMGDFDVVGRSA
jgi:hypothetical protein